MAQRSVILHQRYLDAVSRFDYLVLAFLGALVAYIGKSVEPRRLVLGVSAFSVELAAFFALLGALACGFKRVESSIQILRLNAMLLDANERRGKLTQVVHSGRPGFNLESGDIRTPESAAAQIEQLSKTRTAASSELSRWAARALAYYNWRNRLLVVGFILLVTSRILRAYE